MLMHQLKAQIDLICNYRIIKKLANNVTYKTGVIELLEKNY